MSTSVTYRICSSTQVDCHLGDLKQTAKGFSILDFEEKKLGKLHPLSDESMKLLMLGF